MCGCQCSEHHLGKRSTARTLSKATTATPVLVSKATVTLGVVTLNKSRDNTLTITVRHQGGRRKNLSHSMLRQLRVNLAHLERTLHEPMKSVCEGI
jgi:hypothetical protein